jgi:hypothetical protein
MLKTVNSRFSDGFLYTVIFCRIKIKRFPQSEWLPFTCYATSVHRFLVGADVLMMWGILVVVG